MLFTVEATKALIDEAVGAVPYSTLVKIALRLQAGEPVELNGDSKPLSGFMVIHSGSEYDINPEYKSMLVEAIGRRILQNSASALALEDIIREGLSQKLNYLPEIVIGLENNEMRSLIIPASLSGMFLTVDANKNTSRPKASFHDLIKSVANVLYCERELA